MPKYQNSLFGFKSKIEEIVDFDKISEKISEPRIPIEELNRCAVVLSNPP
jgi:hypothetical protein